MKSKYLLLGILLLISLYMNIEPFGNPFDSPFVFGDISASNLMNQAVCRDDNTWKNNNKSCKDYSIAGADCSDIGENGVVAFDACRVACDNCPRSVNIPLPTVDYTDSSYSIFEGSSGENIGEDNTGIDFRDIFSKLSELEEKIRISTNDVGEEEGQGVGEVTPPTTMPPRGDDGGREVTPSTTTPSTTTPSTTTPPGGDDGGDNTNNMLCTFSDIPDMYNIDENLPEDPVSANQINIQNIQCAEGYYLPEEDEISIQCPENGGNFEFNGCLPNLCTFSDIPDMYNIADQNLPEDLVSANQINIENIQCAEGYYLPEEDEISIQCPENGGNFEFNGCLPNRCTLDIDPDRGDFLMPPEYKPISGIYGQVPYATVEDFRSVGFGINEDGLGHPLPEGQEHHLMCSDNYYLPDGGQISIQCPENRGIFEFSGCVQKPPPCLITNSELLDNNIERVDIINGDSVDTTEMISYNLDDEEGNMQFIPADDYESHRSNHPNQSENYKYLRCKNSYFNKDEGSDKPNLSCDNEVVMFNKICEDNNTNEISYKLLKEIPIIGSHNSAAFIQNRKSRLAAAKYNYQTLDFVGQYEAGVRYFDIHLTRTSEGEVCFTDENYDIIARVSYNDYFKDLIKKIITDDNATDKDGIIIGYDYSPELIDYIQGPYSNTVYLSPQETAFENFCYFGIVQHLLDKESIEMKNSAANRVSRDDNWKNKTLKYLWENNSRIILIYNKNRCTDVSDDDSDNIDNNLSNYYSNEYNYSTVLLVIRVLIMIIIAWQIIKKLLILLFGYLEDKEWVADDSEGWEAIIVIFVVWVVYTVIVEPKNKMDAKGDSVLYGISIIIYFILYIFYNVNFNRGDSSIIGKKEFLGIFSTLEQWTSGTWWLSPISFLCDMIYRIFGDVEDMAYHLIFVIIAMIVLSLYELDSPEDKLKTLINNIIDELNQRNVNSDKLNITHGYCYSTEPSLSESDKHYNNSWFNISGYYNTPISINEKADTNKVLYKHFRDNESGDVNKINILLLDNVNNKFETECIYRQLLKYNNQQDDELLESNCDKITDKFLGIGKTEVVLTLFTSIIFIVIVISLNKYFKKKDAGSSRTNTNPLNAPGVDD